MINELNKHNKLILNFMIYNEPTLNYIKSLKFNKNSISIVIDKDMKQFVSNELYSKKLLFKFIKSNCIAYFKKLAYNDLLINKEFYDIKFKELKIYYK